MVAKFSNQPAWPFSQKPLPPVSEESPPPFVPFAPFPWERDEQLFVFCDPYVYGDARAIALSRLLRHYLFVEVLTFSLN